MAQKKMKDIYTHPMGQYLFPGQGTVIENRKISPGVDITTKSVDPMIVLTPYGAAKTQPNMNYTFAGNTAAEFPMVPQQQSMLPTAAAGGTQTDSQTQLLQIIQMYAQMKQLDAKELVTELQGLSKKEQQKSIELMASEVQQAMMMQQQQELAQQQQTAQMQQMQNMATMGQPPVASEEQTDEQIPQMARYGGDCMDCKEAFPQANTYPTSWADYSGNQYAEGGESYPQAMNMNWFYEDALRRYMAAGGEAFPQAQTYLPYDRPGETRPNFMFETGGQGEFGGQPSLDSIYRKMKAGGLAMNPKKKKGGAFDYDSFQQYLRNGGLKHYQGPDQSQTGVSGFDSRLAGTADDPRPMGTSLDNQYTGEDSDGEFRYWDRYKEIPDVSISPYAYLYSLKDAGIISDIPEDSYEQAKIARSLQESRTSDNMYEIEKSINNRELGYANKRVPDNSFTPTVATTFIDRLPGEADDEYFMRTNNQIPGSNGFSTGTSTDQTQSTGDQSTTAKTDDEAAVVSDNSTTATTTAEEERKKKEAEQQKRIQTGTTYTDPSNKNKFSNRRPGGLSGMPVDMFRDAMSQAIDPKYKGLTGLYGLAKNLYNVADVFNPVSKDLKRYTENTAATLQNKNTEKPVYNYPVNPEKGVYKPDFKPQYNYPVNPNIGQYTPNAGSGAGKTFKGGGGKKRLNRFSGIAGSEPSWIDQKLSNQVQNSAWAQGKVDSANEIANWASAQNQMDMQNKLRDANITGGMGSSAYMSEDQRTVADQGNYTFNGGVLNPKSRTEAQQGTFMTDQNNNFYTNFNEETDKNIFGRSGNRARRGGSILNRFEDGGVYDLDQETIRQIIAAGGSVEYI